MSNVVLTNKNVFLNRLLGSGALPGKMLLVGIIENNIYDAYIRSGLVR